MLKSHTFWKNKDPYKIWSKKKIKLKKWSEEGGSELVSYRRFAKQIDLRKGTGGELVGDNQFDMIQTLGKVCFQSIIWIVIGRRFSNDCDLEDLTDPNFNFY